MIMTIVIVNGSNFIWAPLLVAAAVWQVFVRQSPQRWYERSTS